MKKRSSRPGDLRSRERRFGERQAARGEDDETLATREGRPMRLPLSDESAALVDEELEGNALADGLGDVIDAIRPHLRAIALAALGLVLAAVAWMWMQQQRAALEARSWDDYLLAVRPVDPAALAEVITAHPGTAAAGWARLWQAEISLDEGSQLLFVDRARATPKLEDAASLYAGVLRARPSGLLAERATFGLAKANEALGKIDEARAGYEAVVDEHPDGLLAGPGRQRIAALSGNGTREWYDWFASQRMTPPAAPSADGPILGVPGEGLPFAPQESSDPAAAGPGADDGAASGPAAVEPSAESPPPDAPRQE